MNDKLIYLASPYSAPESIVRQMRYNQACQATAKLMEKGRVVYSPIAHSHPISAYMAPELLMDHEFWMKQCLPMVRACDEFWVLALPGWRQSRGVTREKDHAYIHGKPIAIMTMEEIWQL